MGNTKFDIFDLEGRLYSDQLDIHLVVTNRCNQKCHYCLCKEHPEHVKRDDWFTIDQFYKVVEFINAQERSNVEFYFFGGEPTLHPHLKDFVQILETELGEKLGGVNILTNLTQSVEYYKDLGNKIRLVLSIHTEECKDWEGWFEKAYQLKEYISLLKLVLSERNYDDVKFIVEKYFPKFGFKDHRLEVQAIYQLSDPEYVAKAEKELAKYYITDGRDNNHLVCDDTNLVINGVKQENFLDYKDHKNFMGMMCYTGFWILQNGDVVRCTKAIQDEKLFNIFTDDIKKLNKWGLCPYSRCNCEEAYPKISVQKYIELFNNGRR